MRLLLDTHVLLWTVFATRRLPPRISRELEDQSNEVLFSAASIWEVAIKARLRRGDFQVRPEELLEGALDAGFAERLVSSETALRVADLPLHHGDPFDRLLVAQAMAEPARLYTADAALLPYSELVTLIV